MVEPREAMALAAQILAEAVAARDEKRPPHRITITHAEAVALDEIWGARPDGAPPEEIRIVGVPIQVVD